MIQNFPITASDVTKSHTMFGPKLAGTRSKTLQQNLDRLVMDYVSVRKDFQKLNKLVTSVSDVMFVNGEPFLITMFRGIQCVTV